MAEEKQVHKFTSGASSTRIKPRYDLFPLAGIKRGTSRFEYGASRHGERNYLNGVGDAEFLRDRKNHLIEHAIKYAAGDTSTDHLGAILCNAAILAELEERAGGQK